MRFCTIEVLVWHSGNATPLPWLPVLSNIEPPALRRKAATDKLVEKIVKHESWPIQCGGYLGYTLRMKTLFRGWTEKPPLHRTQVDSALAIPPWVGKVSTSCGSSHRYGGNGESCVTVGPVTGTAGILAYNRLKHPSVGRQSEY